MKDMDRKARDKARHLARRNARRAMARQNKES